MLDLSDIQGLVFSGHGHLPHSRFLFLRVRDRKRAQAWLTAVAPLIASAARRKRGSPKPAATAQIAFTFAGLESFGLDADSLAGFPREFAEGMSMGERPRALGDTDASAPETWQFGGPANPAIHILLVLYGENHAKMTELVGQPWYPSRPDSGVDIVFDQESFRRDNNEPFGFRDGISQPVIEGGPTPADPTQRALTTGEFLLGYPNEYANLSPAPTVRSAADPHNLLPAEESDPARKAFGLNGTYLVLRKLEQDVDGFWRWCKDNSRELGSTPGSDAAVALAAKLVGRWPSGCPLTLSPEQDNPAIGGDDKLNNDFLFAPTDLAGHACPIGSHIRRSNPRDVLHPNNPARSLEISNRHRLMRRGRPYLEETPARKAGLIFIAINADLQRQFEFIQQTWLNNPKFNGLFDDQDPMVSNCAGPGTMTIQRSPVRKTIHGLPQFTTVRGGAYFFLPGVRAIHFLASAP
ncbi:MAG: peroxidase [Gemmatimonadota bacterium]